jgi:hypothetical protein
MGAFIACGQDPLPPPGDDQVAIVAIEIQPKNVRLGALGVSQQLAAVALDEAGSPVTVSSFAWSSSVPEVATVGVGSGIVTSTGNGETVVTASHGGLSGTALLTVRQEIAEVVATPDTLRLDRWGDTTRILVTATDSAGAKIGDISIRWSTTDSVVARVDDFGVVTSWAEGEAYLEGMVTVSSHFMASGVGSEARGGRRVTEVSVVAKVALQRNAGCTVPGAPVPRGAALAPRTFSSASWRFSGVATR